MQINQKKIMKGLSFLLCVLLIITALTSCATKEKKPSVDHVLVNPEQVAVSRGSTYHFSAVVHGKNNPPQTVTWSIIGNNSSSTSISNSGQLTVASAETAVTFTVRATSAHDISKIGNAIVTVQHPNITGIVVTPNPVTVNKGSTQNFTATVNGSNNPPQSVNWTISGNNMSTTTINSNGQLSVAATESSASITVRARSTFDTTKTGTATANVPQASITEIIISPNPVTVAPGGTQAFTAVVEGLNNPSQSVLWGITGQRSVFTGMDPIRGRLVLGENESAGTIIVDARSTFDMSKVGTATVNVDGYYDFAGRTWIVLDRDEVNNRIMIITRDLIWVYGLQLELPYNSSYGNITWEHCSLRAYLNDEYYNSFSQANRNRIHPTTVQNPNNPNHGTPGGNDTNDYIFLLSIEEAQTLFATDTDRIARRDDLNLAWFWWLRSPGYSANRAAYVTNYGSINLNGIEVQETFAVRPVLWLNL